MSERVLTFLSRPDVWAAVAAVVGFLAIALGGYLALQVGIPASIPAFAVGIGLVRWVLVTYRGRRHDSPTIRRLVAFSETALTASLLLGVLIVGNVVAFRYGGRPLDLTRDRAFTLSSLTLNQLRDLDRPVRLTVFFGNSDRSRRQFERVQQLVETYRAASPDLIQVEYLNPFTDIREFEELARRVPDVVSSNDGVVVAYGEGADAPRAVLGTRELFEGSSSAGADRFTSSFRGEDMLTSTLIRLHAGKRTQVAFTTGHNEPALGEADPGRPGYGLWRARLASIGADVVEVNLLGADVPADVSLLVIGGPRAPFQPAEVDRIKAYLARGGPVIVLVDGLEPTGLDDLLATYNVTLGTGVAADAKFHFANRPTIVYAPLAPSLMHPIVAPLVGQVALLQNAAPLGVIGAGPGKGSAAAGGKAPPTNPGIIATPILRTGPESWIETDPRALPVQFDRGKDQAGPAVLGVALTTRPALAADAPVPRMVVFSSPTMADNRLLRTESTNIDLLMNAVSWLRGKPDLIGIAPKTHESLLFAADPGLQLRLVMVPTLAAAVIIVGLGLTTWLARRD